MNNDSPKRPAPQPARRQYFDVVRPGVAPASPTSRPVITRPPGQDPDVSPAPVRPPQPSGPPPVQNIPPASPAPQQSAPPVPTSPVEVPQEPLIPQPQAPPPSPVVQQPEPSEQIVQPQPAPAQQPSMPDPQQFFTPEQNTVAPARHKHSVLSEIMAILVILLLLAVILNILLDAEVIDLPLPHTNFFDT